MLIPLGCCLACSSGDTNNPFGLGTQGSPTPATASASGSEGGSDSSSGVTSMDAADGGGGGDQTSTPDPSDTNDSTTGGGDATTDPTADDTTGPGITSAGDSTTSGAGDDAADDGGMGGGMQPADGMYSPCVVPRDCGFAPELCITITDADDMLLDGFCSETTCTNPAVDCDPSPGGTAPPICIDVTVDGATDSACVLDCTGGATCPTGMTCYALTGISICG